MQQQIICTETHLSGGTTRGLRDSYARPRQRSGIQRDREHIAFLGGHADGFYSFTTGRKVYKHWAAPNGRTELRRVATSPIPRLAGGWLLRGEPKAQPLAIHGGP